MQQTVLLTTRSRRFPRAQLPADWQDASIKERALRVLGREPATGGEVRRGPRPLEIELLILQGTPFCNIACRYCYLDDKDDRHVMSTELLETALQRVFESPFLGKSLSILWHAGEPLALPVTFYKDAFNRISRLQPHGLDVVHSFQTNAIAIDDDWCELFKEHSARIGVSIDGPAWLHDRQRVTKRGSGTHALAMKGIAALKRHGVPFGTITVLTNDSLEFPDEIFDSMMEIRPVSVGFNPEETEGANRVSSLNTAHTRTRFTDFMRRYLELTRAHAHAPRVREFARFGQPALELFADGSAHAGSSGRQDAAPMRIVTVDWTGGVSTFSPELHGQSDPRGGDFLIGNILRESLEDMVLGEKFRTINAEVRRGVEACRTTCDYFEVCGGGSPSNKLAEHGRLDASETLACGMREKSLADLSVEDMWFQASESVR